MREVELRSAPFCEERRIIPKGSVLGGAFLGDFLLRQKVTRHSGEAAGETLFN